MVWIVAGMHSLLISWIGALQALDSRDVESAKPATPEVEPATSLALAASFQPFTLVLYPFLSFSLSLHCSQSLSTVESPENPGNLVVMSSKKDMRRPDLGR